MLSIARTACRLALPAGGRLAKGPLGGPARLLTRASHGRKSEAITDVLIRTANADIDPSLKGDIVRLLFADLMREMTKEVCAREGAEESERRGRVPPEAGAMERQGLGERLRWSRCPRCIGACMHSTPLPML